MKIFILQSLRTTDKVKSGKLLSQKLEPDIPVEFKDLESDIEVFDQLDLIGNEIKSSTGKYIVHFDCHGNEDGIGIYSRADGLSFIKWEDLRDKFRDLYLLTRQRLIISFSSCKGLNVVKLIAAFKPCPFNLITGSFRKIGFTESVNGYYLFYSEIFQGKSVEEATRTTKLMFPALDFNSFTSNALVEIGWNGYFQTQLTPEKVKERKADIIAQAISLRGSITNEEVLFIESRLSLQAAEEDHERFRRIFFS